ncbi:MAG: PAS domain S-box protein, partial [Janthinobacterium lividum]
MQDLAQAVAEHLALSLVVHDRTGVIVLWNAAAQQLYGWSSAEATGRNIHDLLRSRHPFHIAAIERDLLRDGRWTGDVFRTTKTGREICVSAVWTVARSDGVEVIVESAQERVARQADEDDAHRYRNLFHAMSASFWELDFGPVRRMIGELVADGMTDLRAYLDENPQFIDDAIAATGLVDVNDATVEIFDAPSREAILGTTLEWVWPAASRHVYAAALIAASRREYTFGTEVTLVRWDGSPVDLLFTVCWPHDHQAKGTVLVGV